MVNRASDIKKSFGYGDDGKRMFITQYKNGLVNYLFQNAMYNYTQSDTDVLNIPSELIDRYFTGDVFFQNLDYSFADDMLTLIEENPNLKEKYSILNQLAKPELKEGQQILTLNDNKLLKSGQLAESYYENLKELADPNVEKVSNTEKNLYISNMFKLLPLMTIYQNGVGFSKYGFNEALPFDDFLAIMNPISAEFISKENKVPDLTNVFNGIKDPKNRFFRNYVNIVPGRATVAPTQPYTQPKVTGTQITYTPKGKETQTYTVRGAQIFNSAGVEVFKGDSVDRNKVFANLAVAEGRAVVVEHNGSKYVVNKRNQIISGTTGKMMQWAENNGDRLAIVKKAEDKFEANTLNLESDTVKDTEITETPTPNTGNITPRLLVLNSTEFQSWYKGELTKNPNLDVNKALDYYIKCKGL
jgi:hypothetical protein